MDKGRTYHNMPIENLWPDSNNQVLQVYCTRERRLAEFDPNSAPCDGKSTSSLQRNTKLSCLDLLGHTDCFCRQWK